MPSIVNASTIGAVVRDARIAAGMSQTDLGIRIGASRFWVAAFEHGKPRAQLGLALKALTAVGLCVYLAPASGRRPTQTTVHTPRNKRSGLASVIARTIHKAAASSTIGWPTARAALRGKRD